jgi:hypothetical protein
MMQAEVMATLGNIFFNSVPIVVWMHEWTAKPPITAHDSGATAKV